VTAEEAIRVINRIVRTPTKSTPYKSAQAHFHADFEAIRKLCAAFVKGKD